MPSSPGYHHGHLVIPLVAELRLRWQYDNGKKGSNVLHMSNPDGIAMNPSIADDILAGIEVTI